MKLLVHIPLSLLLGFRLPFLLVTAPPLAACGGEAEFTPSFSPRVTYSNNVFVARLALCLQGFYAPAVVSVNCSAVRAFALFVHVFR